jgi:sugar/nucleoside kinase (ribokinase family)
MESRGGGAGLAIVGNATVDCYLPQATIARSDGRVEVECGTRTYDFYPQAAVRPGAKVTVSALPRAMLAQAQETSYGGGAFNSYVAFRSIAPAASLLYYDTSLADRGLEGRLKDAATEVVFGGLHPIPTSVVLGERGDKIILKCAPSVDPHAQVSAASAARLDGCAAVLANSVKDVRLMSHLAARAAGGRMRLYLVLTGSLPTDFVNENILPAARCLFISWDDVMCVGGVCLRRTVANALHLLSCLRDRARASLIFLTLGGDGVLVSRAGRATATHVYLNPQTRLAAEIRELAARRPTHACGCGDAFAAGAFAELETRHSLLVNGGRRAPREVRAALSGYAAALRRLGYQAPLSAAELTVTNYLMGSA